MKNTILFLCLTLWATPISAQVMLKNGTLHTVSGEVIPKGNVLIGKDGLIEAVDTVVIPPAGYEIIDCEGKIITPGLIETGTSLGAVEIWAVDGTKDAKFDSDLIRAAFRISDGINPNSTVIPVVRNGGVTSAVTNPYGGLVAGQSAWIDLMGTHAFLTQINPSVALVASFGEDAAKAAGGTRGATALTFRELFDDVRFFQKNQRSFDENRSRTLSASRLDLIALQDAISKKTPFVFNVDRASDITAVLALSKEFGIHPIISGGAEAWMVAEALAKDKITVIVQPLQNLPFSFESLGSRADNAALLEPADVPVISSTFDTHRGGALRQYAGNAVRAGMTHEGALKAITLEAAQAFGMQKTYGSLEKGKIANIVVWSGDPFEPLTQVEHVFIQGKEASLETRQTRLFEKYRTLQRRGEPAEKTADKPVETPKD